MHRALPMDLRVFSLSWSMRFLEEVLDAWVCVGFTFYCLRSDSLLMVVLKARVRVVVTVWVCAVTVRNLVPNARVCVAVTVCNSIFSGCGFADAKFKYC
ncbi:hypothetical protein DsansV1_C14g0129041 [Dioscorea sansibarensis]